MTAREFYDILSELRTDWDQELVTVIGGEKTGWKLLLTDGKPAAVFTAGGSLADKAASAAVGSGAASEAAEYAAGGSGAADEAAASNGTDLHGDGMAAAEQADRYADPEVPANAADILALPPQMLFWEKLGHPKHLVVCGAGYVGQGVIRLGRFLGWRVTAIDDRIDFCRLAEKAGADETIADDFTAALQSEAISYDLDTYFVVVTRGHRFDRECLLEIMKHETGYVGMMGSRARSARMKQTLLEEGIPEEMQQRLHAPIGLKIGAQTPEEIAISIVSEILAVRPDTARNQIPEDVLEGIASGGEGRQVLATIVSRRGSTPRQAGTRMLIRRDRTTAGTIGGGCMEAEVIREALQLMAESRLECSTSDTCPYKAEIFQVDLTGRTGAQADMLCGGAMDVLLEVL
jgi:xanthine dehydrogenase accessory factor